MDLTSIHSLSEWLACANHTQRPQIMAGTAHSSTVGSYVLLSARLYLQHGHSALRQCPFVQASLPPGMHHHRWQQGMPLQAEDFTVGPTA